MGVQYPIGAAQLTFIFTLAGDLEEMVTTFGCVPVVPVSAAEIAQTANTIVTAANGPFLATQILPGYTYQGCRASLKLVDGMEIGEDFSTPQVGSKAGSCLPSNCAELWDKRSSLGGRRNRGRNFLPPLYFGEGDVDPRGAITVSLGPRNTQLINILQAFNTADLPLAIFHSDGAAPTVITSLAVQSVLATQRDRMR